MIVNIVWSFGSIRIEMEPRHAISVEYRFICFPLWLCTLLTKLVMIESQSIVVVRRGDEMSETSISHERTTTILITKLLWLADLGRPGTMW